ncbi:MAG TPA: NAD(P)-dependent alcohol dehydrogenase [Myxococcales bacterium]|nr:NAD(P)-dependent alcohol dehydrogenase [Myxococcales bacterium]
MTSCVGAVWLAGAVLAHSAGASPPMKAIVYREYGPPHVVRLEEVDRPIPDDDQILVKVRAAAANPLDWHFVRGMPYFSRLGMGLIKPESIRVGVDFAGTVEAVGTKVTQFKPGDGVFGGRTGAFAEYLTVRADRAVVAMPPNVSFEQAASVPVAGVTALQGLRKGGIRPGLKVLVNGASGGVGTFAVQIAKAFGAEVTGVSSARNLEMVKSIGADRVIDYTRQDFTTLGERYDIILDTVGNHSFLECRKALQRDGVYVAVGGPSGKWIAPLDSLLRTRAVAPFVSQKVVMFLAELNKADLATLANLMESGKVKPVIDRRYRLADTSEAIAYLEKGHARGKVIVTVDGDVAAAPRAPGTAMAGLERSAASDVAVLVLIAALIVVPVLAALALDRRYRRRYPGKRPYRWGYYVSLMSVVGGLCLGLLLDAGVLAVVACIAVYALLAWFFALRRRWAWVALTILTFNPVAWIANLFYLRKRWAEDAAASA